MTQRVTVAIAADLVEAANHVHVLLGKAVGFNTYSETNWQDSEGNLYAVSSGIWTNAQIAGVANPEVLAEVAVPSGVNLSLAEQAQAAFQFFTEDQSISKPSPGSIIAVASDDPSGVLAAMSLSPVPPSSDP